LGFRLILYSVCDSVMHLCPFCNRRTINLLDDDDDDDVNARELALTLTGITVHNVIIRLEQTI